MLKLGELKISGMFVGDTKIKKAFLGTELVYEGAKPSRLPKGYTEVEYIDIQGNVGISLGETVNPATFRLVMDLEAYPRVNTAEYIFNGGSYYSTTPSNPRYMWIYRSGTSTLKYRIGYGSSETSIALEFPDGERTLLDLDWANEQITIQGITRTIVNSSFTSKTAILFSGSNPALPCKLYSAKIYKSGVLQKELVPCIEDSSETAGLYDLGSNVFRKSSGGTVTAGPAI